MTGSVGAITAAGHCGWDRVATSRPSRASQALKNGSHPGSPIGVRISCFAKSLENQLSWLGPLLTRWLGISVICNQRTRPISPPFYRRGSLRIRDSARCRSRWQTELPWRHSESAIFGSSALRCWTSGFVLAYPQIATRTVNTKGGFPCPRARDIDMEVSRSRSERKERKEGEEVWEFSYYETGAEDKPLRRAAIVASREEYPTELGSGRARKYRQFCYGSTLSSQRHPGRWSLGL